MKKLIICEKQLAARRIASILSKGKYKRNMVNRVQIYSFKDNSVENFIIGLRGHITALDYPAPYNDWSKVDPRELIAIAPVKVPIAKNIIKALESYSRDATEVVIATDYDREGELIGAEALNFILKSKPTINVKRAKFSALTKADVENAFDNLSDLDEALVKSAECRQNIDLVWGATLTRFISLTTNQLGRNFLSVGRVQTPTLAIVVDRERDIENFVPKPFWNLTALLEKDKEFEATHVDSPFWNKDEVDERFEKAKKAKKAKILDVTKETVNDRGPIPFNTTTFLYEASKLGITSSRAMKIAEDLYTSGFISYPRTDNCAYPRTLNLRTILQKLTKSDLSSLVKEVLESKYRPRNGRATKDHPPIHPVEGATKKKLKGDYWRVYELVVRRFLATLAPDAEVEETIVNIDINGEAFVSKGSKTLFEGWRKYYPYYKRTDVVLPDLEKDNEVDIVEILMAEDQTKPPPRFSHGSLIQLMEKLGLGTKSTRHEIIKKLSDRKYVLGRYLKPTHIGVAVAQALENHAKRITEPDMTAVLEIDMDAIAEGHKNFEDVVEESRTMLTIVMKDLEAKKKEISVAVKEALKKHNYIGKCKVCGKDLSIRKSSNGKRFASCSGHPDCTETFPLPQSGVISYSGEVCDCGAPRIKRRSGKWTQTMCINPKCTVSNRQQVLGKCITCGGTLVVRYSKHGKRFVGCMNFPKCKSTYSLPQSGTIYKTEKVCEVCSCPLIRVVSGKKSWEACINKRNHKKIKMPTPS